MYHLDSALDHSPNLSYLEICRREEWSEFVSQWISLCHKLSAPMELKPVQGMTLLHVAAKFGLQALASAIITSPETSVGDLNTMDGMRRTPSSYATAGNHGSIVNLLSSRGVDLDVSEVNGESPAS
ncbi:hypothetical protein AOQ84DRAFT_119668 [Glonium stellatum]|uniref:Ankyrin repeat protein n=1 Tax=Glonium stellatum TaxID=574774 RepID=A0A8E2F9U1_9PEZI|nr:hypothetical protein AOQ84DRAFT_119668 [Glonium stellatum]